MAGEAAIVTVTLNPALDVWTQVDRISPVHKLRCEQERRDPGGGGINVARVIHRMRGQVLALYPAGGPIGSYLTHLLDQEGLSALPVPIAGMTRESFTVTERCTHQEYRFVLPGPTITDAEFNACLEAAAPRRGAFTIASGSLPPGAPPNAYARFAAAAKAAGAHFVVDASGAALWHALEAGVFLLKANLRELQDLNGAAFEDRESILAACRDLIASGRSEHVALTLGARGALFLSKERAWAADALAVDVVSSVGAGDSFLGAMIWALAAGRGLEDAFRHGVAAGAASLMHTGTQLCSAEDVSRLAAQVTLRPL